MVEDETSIVKEDGPSHTERGSMHARARDDPCRAPLLLPTAPLLLPANWSGRLLSSIPLSDVRLLPGARSGLVPRFLGFVTSWSTDRNLLVAIKREMDSQGTGSRTP